MLNKKLVTVYHEVEGLIDLEALRMKARDRQRLLEFFKSLEFYRLMQAFHLENQEEGTCAPDKHYDTIDNEEKLQAWAERIKRQGLLAIDTETNSLSTMDAQLIGLSLAIEAHQAAYVPLHHRNAQITQISEITLATTLGPILADPLVEKVAHHAKFDWHVLENAGLTLQGLAHDTLLQSYVLAAHERHDLDFLAHRYLQHETTTYEALVGKGKKPFLFRTFPLIKPRLTPLKTLMSVCCCMVFSILKSATMKNCVSFMKKSRCP